MPRPLLKVDILTLFPGMFEGPFRESLLSRAQTRGLIQINLHLLRQWSDDPRHRKMDDRPYGGGAGMVLRPEPLYQALKALGGIKRPKKKAWIVYLTPQGKVLTQNLARDLSHRKNLILICGHYEGIDERIMEWVDQEISIGDFVLTGGEIPAMVLVDAVTRLIPGVVGDPESVIQESFAGPHLDYPHFTRPQNWRKRKVPEVLLSGNHKEIARWREKAARELTKRKRPDLLMKGEYHE